jgi:hypothetical protein
MAATLWDANYHGEHDAKMQQHNHVSKISPSIEDRRYMQFLSRPIEDCCIRVPVIVAIRVVSGELPVAEVIVIIGSAYTPQSPISLHGQRVMSFTGIKVVRFMVIIIARIESVLIRSLS